MTTTAVRQAYQRLIPDVLKVIGFSEFKNILSRPYIKLESFQKYLKAHFRWILQQRARQDKQRN
jgi:hypothetical protein